MNLDLLAPGAVLKEEELVMQMEIHGRVARVSFIRLRHVDKRWGFYNRVVGRFMDNDEPINMPAGEFDKWVRGVADVHSR